MLFDMDDLQWGEFNVTCHTDGCESSGITVKVTSIVGPGSGPVFCGLCSTKITDVITV